MPSPLMFWIVNLCAECGELIDGCECVVGFFAEEIEDD